MTQYRFGRAALVWFGSLLAFAIGFIFVIIALGKVTECQRVGGACGAITAVAFIFLKPIGILVCSAGLGWAMARRIRSLGLGTGWMFAVAGWLFASVDFWLQLGLGGFGSRINVYSFFKWTPFIHLLFVLGFVTFLRLSDHRVSLAAPASRQLWIVAGIAAVHSVLVSLPILLLWPVGMLGLGSRIMGAASFFASIASFGLQPFIWLWLDLAVFIGALSLILLQSRNGDGTEAPDLPPARPLAPAAGGPRSRANGPNRPQGFGRRGLT